MKKHKMCCRMFSILVITIALTGALPTSILNTPPDNAPAIEVVAKKTLDDFAATKDPQEIVHGDVIDGNHPNLEGKLTHEEIDTSYNVTRRPTKRVKKILPPYHSHNETLLAVEKKRDNNPLTGNGEPLRPAVVEELTVTEIRHAVAADINSDSRDKPPRETENAAKNKEEQKEATAGETQPDENENRTVFKEHPDNVTEKNAFASEYSIQGINMQSTTVENETLRMNASNDADLVFEGDLNNGAKLTVDGTVSTVNRDEPQDSQIEGIRLVPDEPHIPTRRTMWDLIREQQVSASEEKLHDINNAVYQEPRALPYQEMQTSKPPFGNFDAESAEVEYETENFQHGLSNIEKHELPFSYALPWLQVKDKEFEAKDNGKETDKKLERDEAKGLPHSARFAAVSSDEELRIPADMSRLLQLSEISELGEDVKLRVLQSGATDAEPIGRTKWYILLLTGNSTIVQRRRNDFTKYLRLNLAARLSVEYDDVKVNKLILAPPRVLVNVSVYAPSDDIAEESQLDLKEKFEEKGEGSLHKLAESNATLLELSGEEYRVVRFLSLQAAPQQSVPAAPIAAAQRDEPHLTMVSSRHEDIEYVIYTFLGSACACVVLLTFFLALNKYFKQWKQWEWRWKREKHDRVRLPEETDKHSTIPPAVIYSGGFPQIRGSWMNGGSATPPEPPANSASNASLLQRYPGIELTASQPASPRHNKLRMFNCRPDRVLVRKLPDNFGDVKSSTTQGQENLHHSN